MEQTWRRLGGDATNSEEVCREIEEAGRQTMAHSVDAFRRESIDALRDAVLEKFGRVDILSQCRRANFDEDQRR